MGYLPEITMKKVLGVYSAPRSHWVGDGFPVRYDGRVERPRLTLLVDCAAVCSPEEPLIELITPDGTAVAPTAVQFLASPFFTSQTRTWPHPIPFSF